jgi:hypothetical protein
MVELAAPTSPPASTRRPLPWAVHFFWPFAALMLFLDSRSFAHWSAIGQWISDLITPLYLVVLVKFLPPERRLAAWLFVPISAVGEGLFSLVFGFYRYRLGWVPVYVPFGHALLLSVGFLIASSSFVERYQREVRRSLLAFHASLVGGCFLLFGDTLSLLFVGAFLLIFRRRAFRPDALAFYVIMGVIVLYIEVLGTSWGCWAWKSSPWGGLHSTNPPTGAFTCYLLGDITAMKAASLIRRRSRVRE